VFTDLASGIPVQQDAAIKYYEFTDCYKVQNMCREHISRLLCFAQKDKLLVPPCCGKLEVKFPLSLGL
jgi:hypothetical protein